MARPNIIIEGKGHRMFQRLLSDTTSSETKNVERRRLDERKISMKIVKSNESKKYFFTVLNTESDTTETFKIKIYEMKLASVNFIVVVKINSVTVVDGDTFSIGAFQVAVGEIEITDEEKTLVEGECCLVTIQIFPSGDDIDSTDQDVVRAVAVGPLVTEIDIEQNYEHLATFTSLFPAGSTYDQSTVINKFIDNRSSEILAQCINQVDSIIIENADVIKQLIMNRVKADITWRAISYSYGTPYELYEELRTLKEEGMKLMDQLGISGVVMR
jgi:hypothetical protein